MHQKKKNQKPQFRKNKRKLDRLFLIYFSEVNYTFEVVNVFFFIKL